VLYLDAFSAVIAFLVYFLMIHKISAEDYVQLNKL